MRRRIIAAVFFLALFGAAGYGWSLVRRGFSAHDQPSALESLVARTARSLAVPSSHRNLNNPYPATHENLRDGLEHFADHCSVCHANNGSGDTRFGQGMYPKPPDMRQALTQEKTDGELYYTIQNGIRLSGMPAFGEKNRTDNESTWKLVLFIRHLAKLTPEDLREMERLNPKSRADFEQEQLEEEFLRGEEPKQPATRRHH
jgi:mono/diheme cytochrome c family protein